MCILSDCRSEDSANSSITLTMEYKKYAGIKKIEKNNYDGLEIMTSLGSNLVFKSQILIVLGLDKLTVSKHTTGKELEQGQYEVELKEECFEIYLEVPERESSGFKRQVEAVGF